MHFISKNILIFSFLAVFISGCVPIIVGGGMMAGGYSVMRDKKLGNSFSDSRIESEIKGKLYKIDAKLYSEVSVVCDSGNVLLTGSVSNPDWVSVCEKESWSVEGVVVVDNNLSSNGRLSVGQMMKDNLITSSARSALICTKDVKSVNYKIKTMDGVIYLLGIARSEAELEKVISKLKSVSNVKKVVSYVTVKI